MPHTSNKKKASKEKSPYTSKKKKASEKAPPGACLAARAQGQGPRKEALTEQKVVGQGGDVVRPWRE